MKTIMRAAAAIVPLLAMTVDAGSTLCNTFMGSHSTAHVPSYTTTTTVSLQPSITVLTQTTNTKYLPLVYTYTVFQTLTSSIDLPTVTDVVQSTSTILTTTMITVPSTITTTSTSTTTTTDTSTTTIATTAGFANIADTVNSQSLNKKREVAHPHAGNSLQERGKSVPVVSKAATPAKQGILAVAQYPSKVDCTVQAPNTHTKTIVSTLPPTTVTYPFYAFRTTSTSTLTTTTTIIPPDVTSINTDFETDTISVTTTSFTTNTQSTTTTATALLHGPTVWNACNANNYYGSNFYQNANGDQYGYYISNVDNNGAYVGSNFYIVANGATSMLECCNNCMQYGSCETFLFRQSTSNCFLMTHTGETCSSQSNHPNFFISTYGADPGSGYEVGNGLCGFTYSGNPNSSPFEADGNCGSAPCPQATIT